MAMNHQSFGASQPGHALYDGEKAAEDCEMYEQGEEAEGSLHEPFSSNQTSRNGDPSDKTGAAHADGDLDDADDDGDDQCGEEEGEHEQAPSDGENRVSEDDESSCLLRIDPDISLPRAPVKQLIMEKLPAESRIHSSSKELISELSMLFLNQLSSIANDVCSEQEKKTICPDHVLDAIIKMNMTHYFPKIADPALAGRKLKTFSNQDVGKQRTAVMKRLNQVESAGKMRTSRGLRDKYDKIDDGLTEEQKNLEQEKLFMEARRQFDLSHQQPQVDSAAYEHTNGGVMSAQVPADAHNHQQAEPVVQSLGFVTSQAELMAQEPLNPTEFFREAIFATDFMAEADGDAAMGDAKPVEDSTTQAPCAHDAWLAEMGPLPDTAPFKFDDADLKELKGASGTAAGTKGSSAGGAGADRAGRGGGAASSTCPRRKEDLKAKEQNDQEMEESKQGGK